MNLRFPVRWLLSLCLLASPLAWMSAAAEDKPAPKKPAAKAVDAKKIKPAAGKAQADKDKAEQAQTEKPKADDEQAAEKAIEARYQPPEGGVEELLKFIEGVKSFEPGNAKEFFAHRQKALPAIVAASKKIIELEKDPQSPARIQAMGYVLLGRLSEIATLSGDDLKALLKDLQAHLKDRKPTVEDLQVAMTAAQAMESKDQALGAEAYASLGELLAATAADEQAKSVAETMQGAGRRLGLVGNELELSGHTVAGEPFDIANLKGKVVLVDFWATWCGPCIAEYPNMKKNYDAYKERGFEIVGISLDQNRQALDEYLKEKEVPWITLHDKENDGQHPAARYYGVFGIPTMFLVGKDGKVVSTSARGEELDRLLADLIGPAESN